MDITSESSVPVPYCADIATHNAATINGSYSCIYALFGEITFIYLFLNTSQQLEASGTEYKKKSQFNNTAFVVNHQFDRAKAMEISNLKPLYKISKLNIVNNTTAKYFSKHNFK